MTILRILGVISFKSEPENIIKCAFQTKRNKISAEAARTCGLKAQTSHPGKM